MADVGATARAVTLLRRAVLLAALVFGFLMLGSVAGQAHAADGDRPDPLGDITDGTPVATAVDQAETITAPVTRAVTDLTTDDRAESPRSPVEPVADAVAEAEPVVGSADPIVDAEPIVDSVPSVVVPVLDTVTRVAEPVVDTAASVVQPVVETVATPAVDQVVTIVEPVLDTATSAVAPVVEIATPPLVAGTLAPVTDTLAPVLDVTAPVTELVTETVTPVAGGVVAPPVTTAVVPEQRSFGAVVGSLAAVPTQVPLAPAVSSPFDAGTPPAVAPPVITSLLAPAVDHHPTTRPGALTSHEPGGLPPPIPASNAPAPATAPPAVPAPTSPGGSAASGLLGVLGDPLTAVVIVAVLALAAAGRRLSWWFPEVAVRPG